MHIIYMYVNMCVRVLDWGGKDSERYISIKCYYFVPMVWDLRTGLGGFYMYFLCYYVPVDLRVEDRNFSVVISYYIYIRRHTGT